MLGHIFHTIDIAGITFGCQYIPVPGTRLTRGETIQCVSRCIMIQSSRYISWCRKMDKDTYYLCIIYSIILRLLLENLNIFKNSMYRSRIVRPLSRYVSYCRNTISFFTPKINTVACTDECHYNTVPFNTILHMALQWQLENINQTWNTQQTPHTSP